MINIVGEVNTSFLESSTTGLALEALPDVIHRLETRMKAAANKQDFELAAQLRDQIRDLRNKLIGKSG